MKTPEEIASEIIPADASGAPALREIAIEAIKRDREQHGDRDHTIKVLRTNSANFQGQVLLARKALGEVLHQLSASGYTDETILLTSETREFIEQGKKIHAIKQLRTDNPGLGLGEAKFFIDRQGI